MSIVTKRGDTGLTGLGGGVRVSKGAVRVESYGTVDELNCVLGFARASTEDRALAELVESVQRELFAVGSALATAPNGSKREPAVTTAMVDRLTTEAHRLEATEGLTNDWSLPGTHPVASAYDVARTVCRRAERAVVRLADVEPVNPNILAYINRLSDLLWLIGRYIECVAGDDARLRDPDDPRPRWSRAW